MKKAISYLQGSIADLSSEIKRDIKIMHVCGTHEHTISRYDIRSLLPESVEVIAGPGCPVCVCPSGDLDDIIHLAKQGYAILTFGDMMRVPSSTITLQMLKSTGCQVNIILGPQDAVNIAGMHPDKRFIFFCVGFETTAGPVAGTILTGSPPNLFYYLSLRYVPKAVDILLSSEIRGIDALIIPGHASIMSGLGPYEDISRKYQMPSCAAGFEPEDVLRAVEQILKSILTGDTAVHNVYKRAVKYEGNQKAIAIINKVFHKDRSLWRGIGPLPETGFFFRKDYAHLDILKNEKVPEHKSDGSNPGCICSSIILGKKKPHECRLFAKSCRPENPIGPCMVSLEGSCRISYLYRKE